MEVTPETLKTVRDGHCRRCGDVNRNNGFDDTAVPASRDFVACRLQRHIYVEMVFAGGMKLRSAFDTHVKESAAQSGAERGRMRCGLWRRQLSQCFAWFYVLLGDAPGSPGSSTALFSCPHCCADRSQKIDIIGGITACCIQGRLPDYDRSSSRLPGMASNSTATQYALTNLYEHEGVRFLLRSLKQAIES
jgi:hypothetical protein